MSRLSVDDLPDTPSLRDTLLDHPKSSTRSVSGALDRKQIRARLFGDENGSLLREGIDRKQHRRRFEQRGHVRIRDVFRPGVAEALHESLDSEVPWTLAYLDDQNQEKTIPDQERQQWSEQQRRARYEEIGKGACDRFQMLRDRYYLDPGTGSHLIDGFRTYLESEEFQAFAESVTGDRYRLPLRAKATRMRPGHFLRMHDDRATPGFASVLQLTRDWLADWGGVLQVLDRTGRIVKSYLPEFNSMVFLETPVVHHVSMVTPWAGRPRYILNLPGGSRQASS